MITCRPGEAAWLHLELAILALGEPGPAAAKLSGACSLELLLKLIERAEVPLNGLLQLALRLLCTVQRNLSGGQVC